MIVVHVHVRVKPIFVEAFVEATVGNASHSVREPGVARFDVLQQADDPSRFILVEVYRSEAAVGAHKQTEHYLAWRDAVQEMMAEPRHAVRFANVFPDDSAW